MMWRHPDASATVAARSGPTALTVSFVIIPSGSSPRKLAAQITATSNGGRYGEHRILQIQYDVREGVAPGRDYLIVRREELGEAFP